MSKTTDNYLKLKDQEFTLEELLALNEIIVDLLKEDKNNKLYNDLSQKLNSQIMEFIPF